MENKPRISNLDLLYQNVKNYRTSAHYKEVMDFCARFRELAPFNAMLVQMQKPGARYVLRESEWKSRYNRCLKPNAQPLIILVPFGPVDYVFEIGDTIPIKENYQHSLFPMNDDDILRELSAPYKTKQNVSENTINDLLKTCSIHSIAFDLKMNAGVGYAAKIEILHNSHYDIRINLKEDKYCDVLANYLISVNKNAESGEQFASIVHELGHLFCKHIISPKNWSGWNVNNLSHSVEEFEAESVSWLICERLNIGNPSEAYLSEYLASNEEIPEGVSIDRIFSAFNEIWKMVRPDAHPKYKDGLLFKHNEAFRQKIKELLKKNS